MSDSNFFDGDAFNTDATGKLFPVQLTGSAQVGGTWYYDWTEQVFDPTTGAFTPMPSPRSGTTSNGPFLVELNNQEVATPCYVWALLRGMVAGQLFYEFQAPQVVSTTTYPNGSTVTFQDGSTLQLGSGGSGGTGATVVFGAPETWDLASYAWIWNNLALWQINGTGPIIFNVPYEQCAALFYCCVDLPTWNADQIELSLTPTGATYGKVVYVVDQSTSNNVLHSLVPINVQGSAGPQYIGLHNDSGDSYPFLIKHESTAGGVVAAHRVSIPGQASGGYLTVNPGETVWLWYGLCDSVVQWYVVGTTSIFTGSGSSSSPGLVPDPGHTAGTTRYLREDATWAVPAASAAVPIWTTYTKTFTDFSAASLSNTLTLGSISARTMLHCVLIDVVTTFTGGGTSGCTVEVGTTGGGTTLITPAESVNTAPAHPTYNVTESTLKSLNWAAGDSITATLRTTGANINALTQGSLTISLLLSTVP